MILADTSVWIDHLHRADGDLTALLERDELAMHPLVIEELALGSIRRRDELLGQMEGMRMAAVLSHEELLALVEGRRLWGRGLSPVDAQLLGSALLTRGSTRLWTRDRRLHQAAADLGVAYRG